MNKAQKRLQADTPLNWLAFMVSVPLWYLIAVMAFSW
jgi:hypothetical protein